MNHNRNEHRQILGRVKREEFIGRTAELEQLVSHAVRPTRAQGKLILLAPLAGVSELLRQTFDSLFNRAGEIVPIHFALPQAETTAVSAAIEFLNTFLLQYIAFRRDEPALCNASLTLNELVNLAPAADADWIDDLVKGYNRHRFGDDDRALVRFCLTAPARISPRDVRPFVMFDAVHLTNYVDSALPFDLELIRALKSGDNPFILAGLRRELLDAIQTAVGNFDAVDLIRLEPLGEEDTRKLVTSVARRQQVAINEETSNLLVQQLEGSPFLITSMVQAARDAHIGLDSYLACERLYVDELMGGRFHRHFSALLEQVAPKPETRAALIRLLSEATTNSRPTATVESWRRRLGLDSFEVDELLRLLHVQELINRDGEIIDFEGGSRVWRDYLKSRFRLDALREPRALVVADAMSDALKRAPQTVARHYRRAAALQLRELISKFNSQLMPRKLFQYDQFSTHKGETAEETSAALDADTDLIRLPQIFHTASGASFDPALRQFGDESSVVAHGFEGGHYIDQNEIVWLVAKIESKLEANQTLVEEWLDKLEGLARQSGFIRTQIWLIANEGFSAAAFEQMRQRNAFGSSRQQFELLVSRLSDSEDRPGSAGSATENEFLLILPMGGDNELLAASTIEQVARRLNFTPEAINQIKTAVVEACINASEHSLSPDRKIYQRFRVENDKLVITISSRGILPSNIIADVPSETAPDRSESEDERRGWGIKLIRTLMDEVEFERVDEGTSLRMTKYLRKITPLV
ncbi:MAG TPA: ATP-binding protein [Pyrinomonadaceae bacterium]|nr:ATP-binding protein [Pyrinomonadaceae bacterium]